METITLELRPRLRSLSAYVLFTKNVEASAIKIKLLETAIELNVDEDSYTLPLSSIKLVPSSLSSLSVSNCWISFRIQIQSDSKYGTYKTEVLKTESKSNSRLLSPDNLPPKDTNCIILCTCCKKNISNIASFKRILELPSSDCEPQEWFCHQHDGCSQKFSLDPKETDLFYSINFFLLHKNIRSNDLKFKNEIIYCSRCLSSLGTQSKKNSDSLKIWNCSIEFKIISDNSIIKGTQDPLSDFLHVFKNTAEFVIGEQILLEAFDGNVIHYILLRTMESKLNCLIGQKTDPVKKVSNVLGTKSSVVHKVLYKCGESKTSLNTLNFNCKYCQVSILSILAGMNSLVGSTKHYPPAYRKAEDFYIGYLPA